MSATCGGVVAARIDPQQQRHALLGQPPRAVEHRRHDLGEREDAAERARARRRRDRADSPSRRASRGARRSRARSPSNTRRSDRAASTTSADGRTPAQLVAAQPLLRVEQVRRDVEHAEVVQETGARGVANVGLGAPLSRTRCAQRSAIRMLWSNSAGRVSRASVRWSATGSGRRIAATASSSDLPAVAFGRDAREERPARGRRARRRLERCASTPGPGSMHSSSGSERRCETSRSYSVWSIVTPPSSSLMPCAL